MRYLLQASMAAAALLLAPALAHAQLSYTLSPSSFGVSPGATVTVSGTLTNTGGAPLFLNGAEERIVNASGFLFDDSAFYTNIIFALNGNPLGAGDSVSSALFDVTPVSAPAGDYTALFTVFGGVNSMDTNPLVPNPNANPVQTFGTALAITVPEPGAVAALSALMTTGGVLLRSRKRRKI